MKNERLLKALLKQPVDRTPVWMMRQAGRYLPEYRATRKRAGDFLTLCKTPELACEVTLQPLSHFDFDAAILFSDILTIPDAMGLGLYFTEGEGPHFKHPIKTEDDILKLKIPHIEQDLGYVLAAVKLIRSELNGKVPLIGFAGSPWTLATYMIEGQPSKNFSIIKRMLYQAPELLHTLLKKITQTVADYLNAQIQAGAQAIMIFDTWGGVLTTEAYQKFSLHYIQAIIEQLIKQYDGATIPSIIFTKGGAQWLEMQAKSGANAIGLDWTIEISDARNRVGDQVALQGNMDPSVLYGEPEFIRSEVHRILAEFGNKTGHVFNLGHGIYPDIDPKNVAIMVDAVHEFHSSAS